MVWELKGNKLMAGTLLYCAFFLVISVPVLRGTGLALSKHEINAA